MVPMQTHALALTAAGSLTDPVNQDIGVSCGGVPHSCVLTCNIQNTAELRRKHGSCRMMEMPGWTWLREPVIHQLCSTFRCNGSNLHLTGIRSNIPESWPASFLYLFPIKTGNSCRDSLKHDQTWILIQNLRQKQSLFSSKAASNKEPKDPI